MKRYITLFLVILSSMFLITGCSNDNSSSDGKTPVNLKEAVGKVVNAKVNLDGKIVIEKSKITDKVTYINYDVDGVIVGLLAVKDSKGDVKVVVDTCQSCGGSPYAYFVQVGDKGIWYYEALVLTRRGYPKIADVIPKLFEWLQDMNWPGADEIWHLLSKLPSDVLIANFENAANKAVDENDYGWMYWLYEFAIENDIKSTDLHNKTLYTILKEKGL